MGMKFFSVIVQNLPYWFLRGQPLISDYTNSKTESKKRKQRGIIAKH